MKKYNVIIIGAGASGMMCAIESGKRGRLVLVLDHASKIGEKISISGGGSCNFTNINISPSNYLSNNSHFCKSALSHFTPADFIALIEKHNVKYEEREQGQLFCSSSEEIIRVLKEESHDAAVNIILNCHIHDVKKMIRLLYRQIMGFLSQTRLLLPQADCLIHKSGLQAKGIS